MRNDVELIEDCRNTVGESTVWDDRNETLYWVDIIQRKVFARREGHALQDWTLPDRVTSIGLTAGARVVLGLTRDVALWDFETAPQTLAAICEAGDGTRLNEGGAGPDGCYWVGTMQNNIAPDGAPKDITESLGRLYRVHPDGGIDSLTEDRFGITNTLVWTDDGKLITADTMQNTLYAYTVAPEGLTERRVLLEGYGRGLPDGSCRDAEGFVWNCRVVGGACVIRIAPDGRIDRVIDLPCSWPTSCTFGGPALDQLFVTSARFTMSDEHLTANPQEGALFRVETGQRGVAAHRFDLR